MFLVVRKENDVDDVVLNTNHIIAIEHTSTENVSKIVVNARTKDGFNKSYRVLGSLEDVASFIHKNDQ